MIGDMSEIGATDVSMSWFSNPTMVYHTLQSWRILGLMSSLLSVASDGSSLADASVDRK